MSKKIMNKNTIVRIRGLARYGQRPYLSRFFWGEGSFTYLVIVTQLKQLHECLN